MDINKRLDSILQQAGHLYWAATNREEQFLEHEGQLAEIDAGLSTIVIPKWAADPAVTIVQHPSNWATVLRQLRRAQISVDELIKRERKAGRIRPSEAAMWLTDIEQATTPISEAVRSAVEKHPTWSRWFETS